MSKCPTRRGTREALLGAAAILGVLIAGLLFTAARGRQRSTPAARTGEGVASQAPRTDPADFAAWMPGRPPGGYGFGGGSLIGLRIGGADTAPPRSPK